MKPSLSLRAAALRAALVSVAMACASGAARAELDAAIALQVHSLALEASRSAVAPGVRIEIQVGALNSRLRLAPCAAVQPYLPPGTRLWGAARIGLRCTDPGVRWNVSLPIRVDVFGPALVANGPLAAGAVVAPGDLREAEVNLSAERAEALTRANAVVGRTVARPLAAGDALRAGDLRARQWFAAGDTVRIVAGGRGYQVSGEGQALGAGLEGQRVRVRTESGRIVSGLAVADRRVELPL